MRRQAFTTAFAIFLLVLAFAVLMDTWTGAQSRGQRDPAGGPANEDRRLRFTHDGTSDPEVPGGREIARAPAEAPAGFDNQTNGFNIQGPAFETLDEDTVVPLRSYNDNRFIFEEVET